MPAKKKNAKAKKAEVAAPAAAEEVEEVEDEVEEEVAEADKQKGMDAVTDYLEETELDEAQMRNALLDIADDESPEEKAAKAARSHILNMPMPMATHSFRARCQQGSRAGCSGN